MALTDSGDIEVMMDLKTYLQNAVCSQRTEILQLEIRHFDRLVQRRHQRTLDMMKEDLVMRLGCRLSTRLTSVIPLLSILVDRAEAFAVQRRRQIEARRSTAAVAVAPTKRVPRSTRTLSDVYGSFVPNRGALVDLYGPGTVFHRIRQRDERRLARLGAASHGHHQRREATSTTRLERPFSAAAAVAAAARERRGIRRDMRWAHLKAAGRPDGRLAARSSSGESDRENDDDDDDEDRAPEKIDVSAPINPALKKLEERVRDWAMNRTNPQDGRRAKPRVTELYQSETEVSYRLITINAFSSKT